MDKYEIGKRLKEIRQCNKISQSDVADYLETTTQKVSSFETGRTRIDLNTFMKLCAFYHISSDSFFNLHQAPSLLTARESDLLSSFRELNDDGQDEVLKYVRYVSSQPEYIKSNTVEVLGKTE